jgi:S-adenosylmethionine decarboxylase
MVTKPGFLEAPVNYSGLHLMANLHRIAANHPALSNQMLCRELCIRLIRNAGLTIVGDLFHEFEQGGGVTGVVVLAESHVTLHTWPEAAYITLDVFVCNYNQDNSGRARDLFESLISEFNAEEIKRFEVIRN